ncbi:rRNA maturation RNase YbeY [Conexibacter sp. DBS9H8]|uniref:rRNA maturation RNase YbeY n=1 Tax=Conexibacter sp. DBS9H8 TaxID=2937801 RepID=UPI00200D6F10|nr:rRNA maturation RNase YbeY [Conexibacter sp. DBS9H8]
MNVHALDIEVLNAGALAPGDPLPLEVRELCVLALASAGIREGHLAVTFVTAERIRELNRDHRGRDTPTDVLSFGVDEDGESAGPRELGDIIICPDHTEDLREAIIHGALHLAGMDHETDEGEMLALQSELVRWIST